MSSQWGSPFGDPTYPVTRMWLSLTTTHPDLPLPHVARVPTCFVISTKYSSQGGDLLAGNHAQQLKA